MSQHRMIESRKPSRVTLYSRSTPTGSALLGFDPMEGDEFCPANDLQNVFGSVESWLAWVLLRRCAGCRTEVTHQGRVSR